MVSQFVSNPGTDLYNKDKQIKMGITQNKKGGK